MYTDRRTDRRTDKETEPERETETKTDRPRQRTNREIQRRLADKHNKDIGRRAGGQTDKHSDSQIISSQTYIHLKV